MKRQSPRGVGARAILAIANDRAAEASQLHSNLMFTAGIKRKFKKREAIASNDRAEMRNRNLAALIDAMNQH